MKTSSVIWGVVLIALGIILGLNFLGIAKINLFFDGWWTLFIIIPCFIDLFKDKDKVGNLIGLAIGVLLLLSCQDILTFDLIWKIGIPLALIIIGFSIIFKNLLFKDVKKVNTDNLNNYWATFGSQNINVEDAFKGANINSVFGSVYLDLTKAKIEEDVVINATAIFGKIDIVLPENIKVKFASTPVFGSISNKKENSKNKDAKTIYIKGVSIFGGIETK